MSYFLHKTAGLCVLTVTFVALLTVGSARDVAAQGTAPMAESKTETDPATAAGTRTIRIASWDLHDLWHQPGVALRRGATVRNKRDFAALKIKAQSLGADIIALQGLGSPQAARILFPARHYFVIFSRELAIRQQRDRDILSNPARRRVYNAIAIRRAAKLRILAREQVLEMADPSPALGSLRPQGQSALAVKLRINKRPVWVVTSRLLPGCGDLAEATDLSGASADSARAQRRSTACTAVRDQVLVLNAWKSRKVTKQDSVVLAVAVPETLSALKKNSAIRDAWSTLTTSNPVKVTVAYNARRRAAARNQSGVTRFVLTNPIVGGAHAAAGDANGLVRQANTVALTGPTRAPGQKLVKPSKSAQSGTGNFVVDALSDFAKAALGDGPENGGADAKPAQPLKKTLADLSNAGLAKLARATDEGAPSAKVVAAPKPVPNVADALKGKAETQERAPYFVRYPKGALSPDCARRHVGLNFLLIDRSFHAASKGLKFDTALADKGAATPAAVTTAASGVRTDCAVTVDIPLLTSR